MTCILGIDPGSRFTGFGVINTTSNQAHHIASGCIKLGKGTLPEKLGMIFRELSALIETYSPDQFAIESVFMHRNADSALKLGQARGAAICAATVAGLPVSEYAPREIKQAVVGKGSADKQQVQHMMRILLSLPEAPQSDQADALAVALCHWHHQFALDRVATASGLRGGRLR
ncbi:MAG: crossover junction endodeoxyribonuclease RuvC [Gammaproteobacteria bacterium]